jgi:hypothetical protein
MLFCCFLIQSSRVRRSLARRPRDAVDGGQPCYREVRASRIPSPLVCAADGAGSNGNERPGLTQRGWVG